MTELMHISEMRNGISRRHRGTLPIDITLLLQSSHYYDHRSRNNEITR